MSRPGNPAALLALVAAAAPSLAAQSVQYRSPAGVEYRSQPDTGAIARAEQALAADPRNISLFIQLGVAQSGARQFREAIATFSRGLALAPNDPMLLRWRGHRYLSLRQFDRALADLTRGSRLDSTNYGIWYHLGIVKYAHGDFAGAADAFARAQRRAPDANELAGATDWLWMALSRAGRSAEAKAMLARRPDSLPGTNAYARRLQLYREGIRPDQVFRASDTGDVNVATLSYGLGNWYLVQGDSARARLWFERSVASGGWPAFGFILSELALARPGPAGVDRGLLRLQEELERLSALAEGRVGVGIIHLESGKELFVNGAERFPMASTFKVPIALTLFDQVDHGRIRLDSMLTLRASDLHPGSGEISHLLNDPGVSLSLLNLTELMLLISDNSATDLVFKAVGSGPAVHARLTALGISGISVDRSTLRLIANAIGVRSLPPESEWSPAAFATLTRGLTDSIQRAACEAFYLDPRDTATPVGMARLLAKLWRGQALSPASTAQLLDIMFRCETGLLRIKGMLPAGIRVAHKTGTLSLGVTNDVGIIELPGQTGHVVLAVFVEESRASAENQERTIAQIARAVYDYFVFTDK
jgi:beta-lactamase class A